MAIAILNFGEAIIKYVNLNIQEIKKSRDELINGFMFLDRRIGKRFMNKKIKCDRFADLQLKIILLNF